MPFHVAIKVPLMPRADFEKYMAAHSSSGIVDDILEPARKELTRQILLRLLDWREVNDCGTVEILVDAPALDACTLMDSTTIKVR